MSGRESSAQGKAARDQPDAVHSGILDSGQQPLPERRQVDRAQAIERLCSVLCASASVDEFLRHTLRILLDVVRADVAVARVREGDRLWSRASVGLDEEVSTGFSLALGDEIPAVASAAECGLVSSEATPRNCRSEFVRAAGVRTLHSLVLVHFQAVVGVIHLGTGREHEELSAQAQHLLLELALKIAPALHRQIDHETACRRLESRDQVLAAVAHDLRNPINVIVIAANSLLQRAKDSQSRRPVERIIRSAQRADRLIRDLMDLSAVETGRFSIEAAPLEPTDVILTAVESQQSLAAAASIILATDLSPDIPFIHGDEERILEVFENLIGNAVKFTSPHGTVTVGASAGDGEVLLWVKDSGSGIPAAQLPHLFERFWQARESDKRGSGLGLTICKAIIDAHGGRIWAESTVGEGTTMFIALPSSLTSPPTEPATATSSILLVDDRPENLLSLKAILEQPEYILHTASSGQEALRLALRERFAVALVDIAMPGMSGLELAMHLKELELSRDVPIIFVTAFGSDAEEIHKAYAAGGVDYLVKPLDPVVVRKKVAVFSDLSRRREQAERRSRTP
jgi:signal transduction histidine kinase/CheY-like chemotaxis protein